MLAYVFVFGRGVGGFKQGGYFVELEKRSKETAASQPRPRCFKTARVFNSLVVTTLSNEQITDALKELKLTSFGVVEFDAGQGII